MFEDIVEVWEVDEEGANRLLSLGWKILQITGVLKSRMEEGLIHSKLVGVASDIAYVMGRTKEVPSRENEYEDTYDYEKRLRPKKKED